LVEGTGTATQPAQDLSTPASGVKLEPLGGYGGGWSGLGAVRFVVAGALSQLLIAAIIQGTPGFHYQMQANTVLDGSHSWQTLIDVPSLPYSPYNMPILDGLIPGSPMQQFYRAVWVP
jgi:hypothetical protein